MFPIALVIHVGIGIGLALGTLLKSLLIAGVVVTVVGIVTWERIKSWFESRSHLVRNDAEQIAFSIHEAIGTNKYKTVYGIFDRKKRSILDAEGVESSDVDQVVKKIHADEKFVIYR